MMIKFLAHGTGSGVGAAEYLEDKKDASGVERAGVTVLRGNPGMVGQIADSLDFKHRYTSGVIAWHLDDAPTKDQIKAVLDDFERVAWAGLAPDRYSWTAVRHDEPDGGVHVHILAARVDLETGKSLNIAPPGWQRDFGPLRDYHNHAHGWARPDDPARSRLVQPGHRALVDAATIREGLQVEPNTRKLLTDYLTQQIEDGRVRNREDILTSLEEIGEITRAGQHYISVKPEGFDKAVRLKGAIYEIDYIAHTGSVSEVTGQERATGGRNKARAGEAYSAFQDAIGKRAEFNNGRYPAKPGIDTEAAKGHAEDIVVDVDEAPAVQLAGGDTPGHDFRADGVEARPHVGRQHYHADDAQPDTGSVASSRTGTGRGEGQPVPDNAQGKPEATGLPKRKLSGEVDNQTGGLSHEELRVGDRSDREAVRDQGWTGGAGKRVGRALAEADRTAAAFDDALAEAERGAAAVGRACKQLADAARRIADAIGRYILNLAQERKREAAKRAQVLQAQNQAALDKADVQSSLISRDYSRGKLEQILGDFAAFGSAAAGVPSGDVPYITGKDTPDATLLLAVMDQFEGRFSAQKPGDFVIRSEDGENKVVLRKNQIFIENNMERDLGLAKEVARVVFQHGFEINNSLEKGTGIVIEM